MDKEPLILALRKKIKNEDMDIPENAHFNDGIITAIEEVEKQYRLEALKKQTA